MDTVSLLELLSAPATRELILREVPRLRSIKDSPQFKTHLSNYTLRTFAKNVGGISPEKLVSLDQQLRTLPPGQRPSL